MKLRLILALMAALLAVPPFTGQAWAAQTPNGVSITEAGDLEYQCVTAAVLSGVKDHRSTEAERLAYQYCAGYFSALNDMLMSLRDGGISPMNICYPAAPMPPITVIKVFIDFVNRHDDSRKSFAMPVALAALAEAFPCTAVTPK
jgi:hypothetical protein